MLQRVDVVGDLRVVADSQIHENGAHALVRQLAQLVIQIVELGIQHLQRLLGHIDRPRRVVPRDVLADGLQALLDDQRRVHFCRLQICTGCKAPDALKKQREKGEEYFRSLRVFLF